MCKGMFEWVRSYLSGLGDILVSEGFLSEQECMRASERISK